MIVWVYVREDALNVKLMIRCYLGIVRHDRKVHFYQAALLSCGSSIIDSYVVPQQPTALVSCAP